MQNEVCHGEGIVIPFQKCTCRPETGEKYYCDTCIVILFTQNGMRHHCRSQEHRRKVAEMSH